VENIVKRRADLGSAEHNDRNNDGQNKQPAYRTASFFAIHVAAFLLAGRALWPINRPP
jgi:hypothetical protein